MRTGDDFYAFLLQVSWLDGLEMYDKWLEKKIRIMMDMKAVSGCKRKCTQFPRHHLRAQFFMLTQKANEVCAKYWNTKVWVNSLLQKDHIFPAATFWNGRTCDGVEVVLT